MSNFDQLMRRLSSQLDTREKEDEERRKQKELNEINANPRREFTESERQSQARQDAKDAEIMRRGDVAAESLSRNNDAFEVSAGRMSPDLYNMRYGGGAAAGGGSGKGGKGSKGGEYQENPVDEKALVNAAKDYNELDPETKKDVSREDYFTSIFGEGFRDRGNQAQPEMSAQDYNRAEYAKQNAFDRANQSEQYGNVAVGFKNDAGETLSATGATMRKNAKGEMYGRMADGSESAPYFSDNQNSGIDPSVARVGGIRGNQKWGGMGDLERARVSGEQPASIFEKGMERTKIAPSPAQKTTSDWKVAAISPKIENVSIGFDDVPAKNRTVNMPAKTMFPQFEKQVGARRAISPGAARLTQEISDPYLDSGVSARNPQDAVFGKRTGAGGDSLWTMAQSWAAQTQPESARKFGEDDTMFQLRKAGVSKDLGTLKRMRKNLSLRNPKFNNDQMSSYIRKNIR